MNRIVDNPDLTDGKPAEFNVAIDAQLIERDFTVDAGQTDNANAARFVDLFTRELMYVLEWGKFLGYDSRRWHYDGGTSASHVRSLLQ